MLAGKAGKVHIHMGDQRTGLDPLWAIVTKTAIPITQIVPTHLARNEQLLGESRDWFRQGGWGDITVDDDDGVEALRYLKKEGVSMQKVTISSDAFGSLPVFNSSGELVRLTLPPGLPSKLTTRE
jgi:beta-aspartyl-dipeptidase (metallo-type)